MVTLVVRGSQNISVSEENYNKELGRCFLTMHFRSHLVPRPRSTAMDFVKATLITRPPLDHSPCLRTKKTTDADNTLALIAHFSETLEPPSGPSEKASQAFVHLTTKCFVDSGKLWKHNNAGVHRLMLTPDCHLAILCNVHNRAGSCGVLSTGAYISERFWELFHFADVAWYVRACYYCLICQKR
jgi:hypothetical protein